MRGCLKIVVWVVVFGQVLIQSAWSQNRTSGELGSIDAAQRVSGAVDKTSDALQRKERPGSSIIYLRPIQWAWIKTCDGDRLDSICHISRTFGLERHRPILEITINSSSQLKRRQARVAVSAGVRLLPGFRFIIGDGDQIEGDYVVCTNDCLGEVQLDEANIEALRVASRVTIILWNAANEEKIFTAPMEDFGAIFSGPATDAKLLERRQAELAKSLEIQGPWRRRDLETRSSSRP